MFPKHLLSICDLTCQQAGRIFELATAMKTGPDRYRQVLARKNLAMLFEKPSLRTRVTFDVGFAELGGYPLYLSPDTVQMGKRESVGDVARGLGRWVDMIVARVYAHASLVEMAKVAGIPVINALSDIEHPCQALADLLTLYERNSDWSTWKLAFVGDGFNVCRSFAYLAGLLGIELRVATPPGYQLSDQDLSVACQLAGATKAQIRFTHDPVEAVSGVNAVYTDVWTSMGQEQEKERRLKAFAGFQINKAMMSHAQPGAVVMHCMPAHRGEEITDEVMDGPNSVVLDQAENRLHVQKAVMAMMLTDEV